MSAGGTTAAGQPCGTFVTDNVPADKVGQVIADYDLDGPKSVTKTKNTNGTFKVTAVFPDCPDGSNPTAASQHGS